MSAENNEPKSDTEAHDDPQQSALKDNEAKADPTDKKQSDSPALRIFKDPQWWQVFAAAILVPAGFYALIIYHGQLDEMRKSSQSATKALLLAEESSRVDQRAWLTVTNVGLIKPLAVDEIPQVEIRVANSGKTPALNCDIVCSVMSRSASQPIGIPKTMTGKPISQPVIGPSVSVTTIGESTEPFFRQSQIEAIQNGSYNLYVFGIITYCDIFKQRHFTNFCAFLSGPNLKFASCETGNTISDANDGCP